MSDREIAAQLRIYVGALRAAARREWHGLIDPASEEEVQLLALADRLEVEPGRGLVDIREEDVTLLARQAATLRRINEPRVASEDLKEEHREDARRWMAFVEKTERYVNEMKTLLDLDGSRTRGSSGERPGSGAQ
jgi:hypothetical protein